MIIVLLRYNNDLGLIIYIYNYITLYNILTANWANEAD